MPDVERGLCNIFYRRCSTLEFHTVVKSLHKVQTSILNNKCHLQSPYLRKIFEKIPHCLEGIEAFVYAINENAAKQGDKTKVFKMTQSFPKVEKTRQDIRDVESELLGHRKEIRYILRIPAIDYCTVSGTEYLIEVRNSLLKSVPAAWEKISATKQVTRFHSPTVSSLYRRLCQLREQLLIDCSAAWQQFLDEFSSNFQCYRLAVQHLAELCCLMSLAEIAKQEGYTRPLIVEHGPVVHIESGRHPVISLILDESKQYVPNDTDLNAESKRCSIITGPNMGGKSSYLRQVALICILGQIGSWVPAKHAVMSILDGIFTRMGAYDDICRGQSTFMVELNETSEIMANATCRSLVILDELGRGTSTHDGAAIAYATLRYFITEVNCLTLFVTHYQYVAELEKLLPQHISNHYMSFLLHDEQNITDYPDRITFLYKLTAGIASKSYGLNVARLAGMPDSVLQLAYQQAMQLEERVRQNQRNLLLFSRLVSGHQVAQILESMQSENVVDSELDASFTI